MNFPYVQTLWICTCVQLNKPPNSALTGSKLKMKHKHFPDGLVLHLSTPKFTLLYSHHLWPTIKLQISLTHLKQYQTGYQCYHTVCTCKGAQVFQKSTGHLKNLCARRLTRNKLHVTHTEFLQTLGTTAENLISHTSWCNGFVHPSVHTSSLKQYMCRSAILNSRMCNS